MLRAAALRSGSKFSVWYCEPCKHLVLGMNTGAGRCILPVGRHSVHAGLLLRGEDADDPVANHLFLAAVTSVFETHKFIYAWGAHAVRRNLVECGFQADSVISLQAYLTATASISPIARFREMLAELKAWNPSDHSKRTSR